MREFNVIYQNLENSPIGEITFYENPLNYYYNYSTLICQIKPKDVLSIFLLPEYFTCYVKIPESHPLTGLSYDEMNEQLHCGINLTFHSGNIYGFDTLHPIWKECLLKQLVICYENC